jgi:hypothetical protein
LGIEPPLSAQTIVFAAMFSSVVSIDESVTVRDFGIAKSNLVENLRLGTEAALVRANFLRTTKLQTLQGFVMYLVSIYEIIWVKWIESLEGQCLCQLDCTLS